MEKHLTCIVCPLGCQITVELENGSVTRVSGNTCKRGERYAIEECTHPVRTVTSTVKSDKGSVIPVKTDAPIPKDRIFLCMQEIKEARVEAPIRRGDIVIAGVAGTSSNIIATSDEDA